MIKSISILMLLVGVVACSKVEYDWKGLGFSSNAEMEAAHLIGYHTKVKLDEMRPMPSVGQVAASVPNASLVEPAAATVSQAPIEATPPPEPAAVVATVENPASPSFNCAKASTDVERMICSDDRLAALDNELNTGYKMIYKNANADDQARIKNEQLQWLKTSRNVCKDKACIASAYEERVREMTGD